MARSPETLSRRLSTPVFVFDDYVDYLKAWFGYAKRFGLTQAAFMKKAGIGSQAYFSDILARRKKLAPQHVDAVTGALELSGDAAQFFSLLVIKAHAKSGTEQNEATRKCAAIRSKHLPSVLADADAEYFSSWKYPLIREYIISKGTVYSLRQIKQSFLHFGLPLDEIRRTVVKLEGWGMVKTDPAKGTITPAADPAALSYKDMPHSVVNDVKRHFIESSVQAMETLPAAERHVSMAVKGLSRVRYEELCRRIDALRKEFLDDVHNSEEAADHVYGLSVQLFPMMRVAGDSATGNDLSTERDAP